MVRDDGHYDVHGITPKILDWITRQKEVMAATGPVTITLPDSMDPIPNSLIGPSTGYPPVNDDATFADNRGERAHKSRMMHGEATTTRTITIIARPHKETGKPFIITAFGGPLSPKEPNDPYLKPEEKAESEKFWSQHALLTGKPKP